jgi:hypothetical protein
MCNPHKLINLTSHYTRDKRNSDQDSGNRLVYRDEASHYGTHLK